MKKIFILRLLLLVAVSISIHSCRSEDLAQENESQKQKLRTSVLRFHEISNNTPLLKKVQQLQSELFSSKSILGKNNSVLDGAIISTDKIVLVENGNRKTYTFPVKRNPESNGLENLVLKQNSDGTFSGVLIQYDITPLEKDLFVLGEEMDMTNKLKIYEINDLSITQKVVTEVLGCFEITWEDGVCASTDHHVYGQACNMTGSQAAKAPGIISIVNTCSGGSGGEDTGIPNYPDPNSPGGNTGGYNTLPYSDDSDMMLLKYQQFSTVFHINTYGFPTALRTKLFHLYLYQNEDEYIVSKLLSFFGTKPEVLNGAVDLFIQNSNLTWDEFHSQFLTNPCLKIQKVGKHATTKSLFENLKTKTNSTKEFGEVLETSGTQINNYHVEGVDNEPGINLNISGGQIDGFIHSHYIGLLSVFSPGDLASISYLYKNNIIKDINTFVLGVVTASGTQYMMVIDNPTIFETFAEQFLKNGEISEVFTDVYGRIKFENYGIKQNGLADDNELGFVKFLSDENSGLKILKGSNNSNTWEELTLVNGQVVPVPCN